MYGMCRKFSAWSSPYPTRNSFGASNPTNFVGYLSSVAMCLCNRAQISSERGFRAFNKSINRVSVRPEAELEGVTGDGVLDGVLASVPVPR